MTAVPNRTSSAISPKCFVRLRTPFSIIAATQPSPISTQSFPHTSLPTLPRPQAGALRQRFISTPLFVLLSVAEQEVDQHAQDWEEEHDQAPENLVAGWSVGFEDFDYRHQQH
jgi:hypothetical protein